MNIRQLLQCDEGPFPSHPQVGRFFASASIEDARQRLGRSVERGDGPGVVIGSAGTGKSLLLQVLAAQYRDRFDVVLLACTQVCTRRALLQAILFELGLDYRLRDEGELRLSLLDQLLSGEQGSTGLLLVVDEAQLLPARLLEELRMLTNVVRGGVPRVRLVLAGLPALEEVLASPELESFSQRVAARCYLAPFSRAETIQYGRAQIAASGAEPDRLFASEAWHAVFDATDGVPRLVNQLCSRALWLADDENRAQIDRTTVQAAWADLQQLPTPWETAASPSSASDTQEVVEFGSLGDEEFAEGEPSFDPAGSQDDSSWERPAAASVEIGQAADEESNDLALPSHAAVDGVQRPTASAATWPVRGRDTSQPEDQPHADWESNDPLFVTDQLQNSGQPVQIEEPQETVDPFDVPFDEEEIVLDNFATWDSTQDWRSPRVENLRDRGFSTLVQQALDVSATETGDDDAGRGGHAQLAHGQQQRSMDDPDTRPPRVRLAVVSEPAPLRAIPVVTSPAGEQETGGAATKSDAPDDDPRELSTISDLAAPADEDDILEVVEESEALSETNTTSQSEKYWQLFSRLRGK